MLHEFAPLKIGDENEETVLIAVGMNASAKPIRDFFNSDDSPYLPYFFAASFNKSFFFTTGDLSTPEKGENLVQYVRLATKSTAHRRLTFIELHQAEASWQAVCTSHYILTDLQNHLKPEFELLHLNLPLAPFFIPDKQETRLPKTLKTLRSLSILLNMEAWVIYCSWITPEIKTLLTSFKVEAAEDFRLEAKLQDFVHETESDLLQNLLKKINECLYAREKAKNTAEQISVEKQLVTARLELLQQTKVLLERINACLYNIEVINASSRIEFTHLVKNFRLLKTILSEQVDDASTSLQTNLQFFALLELFHQLNGILCCTTLAQGNFIFCLRIAVGQIQTFFDTTDLIDVLSQWDQLIEQVNLAIIHQKKAGTLKKHTQIVKKFRELIYQNLINISQPLKKIVPETLMNQDEVTNPLFYNFLPDHGAILTEEGEWKMQQIVEYDAAGKPRGYTKKGLNWLKKII